MHKNDYKKRSKIKISNYAYPDITEEEMVFFQQIGVEYCFTWFEDQQINRDYMTKYRKILEKNGIKLNNAANYTLAKNTSIHLALSDRDYWIDRYKEFIMDLSAAGIYTTTITWEPMGVLSSENKACRSAITRYIDSDEIIKRPAHFNKVYEREAIWNNFCYFIEAILPYCEKYNVSLALHPNDPPLPFYCGVPSLIYNMDCYKRIFKTYPSPYLGMEFCVGCWLEAGENFGDLIEGLKYFNRQKKIFTLHFRNVNSPMPQCMETFLNNGYMDMSVIMQTLIDIGYDGTIVLDHSPVIGEKPVRDGYESAYSIGYIQGLHDCCVK